LSDQRTGDVGSMQPDQRWCILLPRPAHILLMLQQNAAAVPESEEDAAAIQRVTAAAARPQLLRAQGLRRLLIHVDIVHRRVLPDTLDLKSARLRQRARSLPSFELEIGFGHATILHRFDAGAAGEVGQLAHIGIGDNLSGAGSAANKQSP